MEKIDLLLAENSDVWKTKAAFMSYIRGGVRRSLWNRHPTKTKLIKEKRFQIPNPNPNGKKPTVWGGECEICKGLFVESKLQVDHIRESGSTLKDIADIQKFIEDIVIITKDDLRWVCVDCHAIVSHAQKKGVSFDVAKVQKEIIHLKKENKLLDKCIELGVESSNVPKTKKAQEALVYKLLLEGGISE